MNIKETIGNQEQTFLFHTSLTGMKGLLLLRRLRFFGVVSITPLEDLAKHSGCSVASVKRYLTRMREGGFLKIESRRRDAGGNWLANRYTLLPLAIQYLAHFSQPPQLTPDLQISKAQGKKTCSEPVSYGIQTIKRGNLVYEVEMRIPSSSHAADVHATLSGYGKSLVDSLFLENGGERNERGFIKHQSKREDLHI